MNPDQKGTIQAGDKQIIPYMKYEINGYEEISFLKTCINTS